MKRLNLISNHLSEPLVKTEIIDSNIALITLNRPSKLNALSPDLWTALNGALKSLESNPSVHVYVLTSSGKHFCVGADVDQFLNLTTSKVSITHPIESWSDLLPKLKKPIIAAVQGYALGGGCEIAMMCDIIICDKTAKFGQPEIKLALIPGAGGTQRLVKAVGKSKAMEMILTGDPISAQEAKDLGLVSKIVTEDVTKEAIELARKISKFSLPAVVMAKKAILNSFESNLQEGLKAELYLFNQVMGLDDKNEGVKALLEKRQPKFKNS